MEAQQVEATKYSKHKRSVHQYNHKLVAILSFNNKTIFTLYYN